MSRDWQQLLYSTIPLSVAMQVGVIDHPDGRAELTAPLAPNVNDKGTGFGGSLATLATLAGWIEVRRQLDLLSLDEAAEIVIQHGNTEYLHPVTADFTALVEPVDAAELARFGKLFARRGMARLGVRVQLLCDAQCCAVFHGEYVASSV